MVDRLAFFTTTVDCAACSNADQAEASAVRLQSAPVDVGLNDEHIIGAMDDYEAPGLPSIDRWASEDTTLESGVSDIGGEIQRRIELLADRYPFKIEGNSLIYTGPSRTRMYEFCLAVSLQKNLSSAPFNRLPAAFEEVAECCMRRFLGSGAGGLRTGYSSSDRTHRKLKEWVDELAVQTGEWQWQPAEHLPLDPPLKNLKDGGVDFVTWKRVFDRRRGMLMFVGQCACGDGWEDKFHEIDADFVNITQWVRYPSLVKMTRVFATPHHISNPHTFENATRKAGLILDRVRLVLLAEEHFQDGDAPPDTEQLIAQILN
jgi:hypothetical protein